MANRKYLVKHDVSKSEMDLFRVALQREFRQNRVVLMLDGSTSYSALYDLNGSSLYVFSQPKETVLNIIGQSVQSIGSHKGDLAKRLGVSIMPDKNGRKYERFVKE